MTLPKKGLSRLQCQLARLCLIIAAGWMLVFGAALWLRQPWAIALWPWADGKLSYLWISSILLSHGATLLWYAISLELNAACGAALGLAVMYIGIAGYMGRLYAQRNQRLLLAWVATTGVLALGALLLLYVGSHMALRETRSIPRFMRFSFLLFVIALGAASFLLLSRAPVAFPWKLNPDSSFIFGWPFVATGIFFADAWLRPSVGNARSQLLGFFVYDVVLIPPYLQLWPKTKDGYRAALLVYLIILFWSAVLAVWLWTANRPRHKTAGSTSRSIPASL